MVACRHKAIASRARRPAPAISHRARLRLRRRLRKGRVEGARAIYRRTSTYEIELPAYLSKVIPKFHASRLRPHFPNDDDRFPSRALSLSPPIEVDGDLEFEVERILLHRHKGGKMEYYVRWKGYGAGDDTWEPEANLVINARESLGDYAKANGLDPPPAPTTKAILKPKPRQKASSSGRGRV
jgi:Chromo (CHRromatin Organisation MOdifier) domain